MYWYDRDTGRFVTSAASDLDRLFPEVARRLFGEEIEDVLLISQRDRWPTDSPRESDTACAPYDLAVTLADVLGVRLPEATGISHMPH